VRVAGVQLPSAWSGARRHPIHWLHLLIADPMLKTVVNYYTGITAGDGCCVPHIHCCSAYAVHPPW
jgi:hypothetical protein